MPQEPPEKADDGWFEFPEISWATFWDEFLNIFLSNPKIGPWLVETLSPLITAFVTKSIAVFIEVVAAAGKEVGEGIKSYEKETGPTLAEAAAEALSDYFDTPVSASEILGPGGVIKREDVARRIGSKVLATMLSRLQVSDVLTPETGKAAAESMVGFTLSTSIESWLAGVISHPILQRFIPNWADLDELIDKGLGLRGLAAGATRPVGETVIGRPFTWYINRTYRPERLGERDAVRAWINADLTEDQFQTRMAELGWKREDSAIQKKLRGRFPFKEDLARMLRLGMIDEERATELFRNRGFLPEMSELLMAMYRDLGIDEANQRTKTLARTMFAHREIDEDRFRQVLAAVQVREAEIDKWVAVGELERSRPKGLSEADMERAFKDGLIPDATLEDYYKDSGYSEGDVALLMRMAVQARAEKEGVVDKVKTISQGKAERAFQLGVIRESQLREIYEEMGYDTEDVTILLKTQKAIKKAKDEKQSGSKSLL